MDDRGLLTVMTIAAGTRLGSYEILSPLGAGGMGEVYRARDERLHRDVAIKVLPHELAADPGGLARFEREARAIAALTHPGILTIHDVGKEGGVAFLVTELLEGETLRDRLRRGALPCAEAAEYARELADALAAAHDRGLVHRDIKPENVFLTRTGHVKLLDFGLAKDTRQAAADPNGRTLTLATRQGMVLGTVGYMSPEQVRGEPPDLRSDVFSFGVVLYEMLSGKNPFARASAADTTSAVLRDEPPPLSSHAIDLPTDIERVVARCLEKRREARFSSARDLAFALSMARAEGAAGSAGARSPSLVVLPFANLSPDPEDEYWSDGLTDEIIADLSRIRELRVVSSPSAFRLKGTSKPLQEIAGELQVDHVLVGRMRKSGRSIRLTAQLVQARDDRTIWAEKYAGQVEDAFELQERISHAIAEALEVRLRSRFRAPISSEATEAYHRGRHFFRQATTESLRSALASFEEATRLEPGYAPAFVGVAESLVRLAGAWDALPARDTIPKARAAAQRALELDATLSSAHVARGCVATFDWDLRLAERCFTEALRLNPNDAEAHRYYAEPLMWLDIRFEDALRHARRAVELEPLNPWFLAWRALVLYFTRRFDDALDESRRLVAVEPYWGFGHYYLGICLGATGRPLEACASFERAIELAGRSVHNVGWLGAACALAGREVQARDCLAELESHGHQGRDIAVWELLIHACFADDEAVIRCLERAYRERSASLVFILTCHFTDGVRGDARFEDLLRRMNLEHLASYRPQMAWRPRAEWREAR